MTTKEFLDALGYIAGKVSEVPERPIPDFKPREYTGRYISEAEYLLDMAERMRIKDKSSKRALKNFIKAADMGSGRACCILAYELGSCNYYKKDIPLAIKYARKAADMNYIPAFEHLGSLLEGEGRYEEAAESFRQGAEQGDGACALHLARLYESGKGLPEDKAEAAFWYKVTLKSGRFSSDRDDAKRALKKLEGSGAGYLEVVATAKVDDSLGIEGLYDKGRWWLTTHEAESLACLLKAAELRDPWSLILLGEICCDANAKNGGFDRTNSAKSYGLYNEQLALRCYREGIPLLEKREDDGAATCKLGIIYLDGVKADSGNVLIEPEPALAEKYLLMGAELGHRESQAIYGRYLREHDRPAEALKHLMNAGDQQHVMAACMAGEMLEKGEGCRPDKDAAVHFYKIAAAYQNNLYGVDALAALTRMRKKRWWPF